MTGNQADEQHNTAGREVLQPTAAMLISTRIPDRHPVHDDDNLPPYSETDPSDPTSTPSFPQRSPPSPLEDGKPPELVPMNTRQAVVRQGPLRILRSIQPTSRVSLQHYIHVVGNANASTDISLLHDVVVTGDLECGGKVFLSDGVIVTGRVTGRYIEFSTMATAAPGRSDRLDNYKGVNVHGNLNSSESTLLSGREMYIKIAGRVFQSGGSMLVEGDVLIELGIHAHGGVSFRSFEKRIVMIQGQTSIEGILSTEGDVAIENLTIVGTLNIEGRLHIKGDFKARGCVYLKRGSQFVVDGKQKIRGVIKEVSDFNFKN